MTFSAYAVELAIQIHIHQFFKNTKNNSVKLNKKTCADDEARLQKHVYIYVVRTVITSNVKIRTGNGSARGKT